MVNMLQSLIPRNYEEGCLKLGTLRAVVSLFEVTKGWSRAFPLFLSEPHAHEKAVPADYQWNEFRRWLKKRFKYDPETHELQATDGGVTGREVRGEAGWNELLEDIARGRVGVYGYGDITFRLKVRPQFQLSEIYPRLNKNPTVTWQEDWGPVDSSDYEEDAEPEQSAADPAQSLAVIEPPARALSTSVEPETIIPSIEDLQLEDQDQDEYRVQQAQDDDFGAIDDSFVDTYVGHFNASDTREKWDECLEFFRLPANTRPLTAGKKRVPLAKLPGMSVGLFDYQFIAVLKLLRLSLNGVHGGLLADEQGLGKTQEMFGAIALANNLRRCKNEVVSERRAKKPTKHTREGATAKTCFADRKYGFKCYCYHRPTQELADRLPEGPNVIIAPSRSCAQLLAEAKAKLDTTALKLRLQHDTAKKEDKLTKAEVKSLTATVTATRADDGSIKYNYKTGPGLSDYVIITSPELLSRITDNLFGVSVTVNNEATTVGGLLPGMVLMDEFHEYALSADSPVIQWLDHLKKSSRGKHPLMYFVSGTPFDESPADIRSALYLLSRPEWATDPNHIMAHVTVPALNKLTETYERLVRAQSEGVVLEPSEIAEYRQPLNQILKYIMVRRLGVDKFQNRPLTDIGSLSVGIIDHPVPAQYLDALKALSKQTQERAKEAARNFGTPEDPWGTGRFLRSDHSQDIILKLRLATTFPGIAVDAARNNLHFTFETAEVVSELEAAGMNIQQTRYFTRIPAWSAHSPKLATIEATIGQMLADKKRIEGEASHAKKLVIFCPLEAEALLIYGYLLLRIAERKKKNKVPKKDEVTMKPTWIHSGQSQTERHSVINKFLELGNAPPNILIAPLALAGTGLNLQRANYSIVTGPAWTKRETQQAYYRIHRVGQKQQTKLQLLTAKWNPVDRVILAKYEGKEVSYEDQIWEISDEFGGDSDAFVSRHQQAQ